MGAWIVILIILAVIALILCIPVRVDMFVKYENKELEFDYVINYAFLKIKSKKSGKLLKFLKAHIDLVEHCLYAFFVYKPGRILWFKKFLLTGRIGTDDAMQTALIYGSAAAFVYNLVGLIERNINTDNLSIDLQPDFTEEKIFVDFRSIIVTRIYKVIGWAWFAYRRAIPILKERRAKKNGKSN